MMAALAFVYVTCAAPIVGFFNQDPHIVSIAHGYLAWVAPSYVALGIGIVLGSVMQGAGAPERALALDASVVFLVQVPASVLVLQAPGHNLNRVWLVVVISYVAFALTLFTSYKRGRFLRAALA